MPTCWQGVAATAAVPVTVLAGVFGLMRLSPLVGLIAMPFVLLGGLAVLFTVVAKRCEP